MIGGCDATIQRIIGIGRHLALAIRDGRHIAVVVVGVGLGIEQRIFARRHLIHVRIGIDRLLGLRIVDGEKITVRIVTESCHAADRIGELRDSIQGIRGVEGFLSEGVGEAPEAPGRIEDALGLTIQWVFDLDQIAQFVGGDCPVT